MDTSNIGLFEVNDVKNVILAIAEVVYAKREYMSYFDAIANAMTKLATLQELDLFNSLMMDASFVNELNDLLLD